MEWGEDKFSDVCYVITLALWIIAAYGIFAIGLYQVGNFVVQHW